MNNESQSIDYESLVKREKIRSEEILTKIYRNYGIAPKDFLEEMLYFFIKEDLVVVNQRKLNDLLIFHNTEEVESIKKKFDPLTKDMLEVKCREILANMEEMFGTKTRHFLIGIMQFFISEHKYIPINHLQVDRLLEEYTNKQKFETLIDTLKASTYHGITYDKAKDTIMQTLLSEDVDYISKKKDLIKCTKVVLLHSFECDTKHKILDIFYCAAFLYLLDDSLETTSIITNFFSSYTHYYTSEDRYFLFKILEAGDNIILIRECLRMIDFHKIIYSHSSRKNILPTDCKRIGALIAYFNYKKQESLIVDPESFIMSGLICACLKKIKNKIDLEHLDILRI